MTMITDYINADFRPLDASENIAEVQDFFADNNFSHFPVIEDGIYIGSIAAEDVEAFDSDKTLSHYRYTLEGFFARKNMIWMDVLEVFARNHSDVIPVLDEENKYVGYYEISDIIKFFNETPFLKEQGGIIIVEKNVVDYSMGQIIQIVESNNGKVLGAFVSNSEVDTIQVTVKIALGSMNEIIQTFRRYEYEIISEHQEDIYLNDLKERSDYLDKYLNI
ncbi:CBS domain-containing protein [Flavobacterium sp. 3HN19-14]|uniref:CBS domain-containing protein n=1 Tax=Flavobacterium sp. 3HN19-14 TaxID=3448133 RepID=UPI003EE17DFB